MNLNSLVMMGFEILILLFIGVCVYLKLIPNDLLLLAIGYVIRGTFGVIPAINAINANTQATQTNTQVTMQAGELPGNGGKQSV